MVTAMNLNRYEIFLKVAEIGNITKTAEVLHYTQAGISHAIAALEKEAGVPLLIRSSSGVALTESGKRLLAPVQNLVNDQCALAQTIYEINKVIKGTLRIGTFTSVSTQWLPAVIRDFQALYPQVEFNLVAGDYDDITERIRSGKIDCGFLTAPASDDLLFIPLCRDPMMVLLPPSHPLAKEPAIRLSELKKEPFILPMKGSDNDIMAVLNSAGFKAKVCYTLNDDFSVIAMVSGGFGITIMPELILRNLNAELAVRPLAPERYRTIGIASQPANRTAVLTRTFLEYLAERFNTDRAGTDLSPAGR